MAKVLDTPLDVVAVAQREHLVDTDVAQALGPGLDRIHHRHRLGVAEAADEVGARLDQIEHGLGGAPLRGECRGDVGRVAHGRTPIGMTPD